MTEKAILYKNGHFRKLKSCLMCGCSQDVEAFNCGTFKICGELWVLLDCEYTDKRILIKDSDKILGNCPLSEPDGVRLLVELSEPITAKTLLSTHHESFGSLMPDWPIIPDGPIEFIQVGIPWIKIEEGCKLPECGVNHFVRFVYLGADNEKVFVDYAKASIDGSGKWTEIHDEIFLMDGTVTHYAITTEPED